jgi:hypothetical protein
MAPPDGDPTATPSAPSNASLAAMEGIRYIPRVQASPSSFRQDVSRNLGHRLRQWRESQELPLRSVAARLGVTCATVSCWECGKRFPSGKHIDALAALTGLLPCQFFCHLPDGCPLHCQKSSPCI